VQVGSVNGWSERVLSRFRRVTTSGAFISEIDGLRFIAIGTVVLFHLVVNLGFKAPLLYAVPSSGNLIVAVARHGFRGVELFFIISGFILAYPFASHYLKGARKVELKSYFLRRVTRLEPPYILCMILLFGACVIVRGDDAATLLPRLGASLVYMHNLIFGGESPINNVAWSLEIEIQFYVLVPLLARIFAIRDTLVRRSIIIGLAALSAINSWLFIAPGSIFYLTIARFLHFFLLGFLLSDVFILDWKEAPTRSGRWDVVSLLGWPALFFLWNSPEISHRILPWGHEAGVAALLFPVLAFFLYQAVFLGSLTNRVMTNPWITTIGGMCYTIYLFHNHIIGTLVSATRMLAPFGSYSMNLVFQAALVLPPTLLLCGLYFIVVERPCMRKDWPRRLAGRGTRMAQGALVWARTTFS
jgi:peptidoglycan/LPS O-acetylase OafA/YrhL